MSVLVVIPAYNEEKILEESIETLRNFLIENFSYPWKIIIVDNGSMDDTLRIAEQLSKKYENIGFLHINEDGRGRALREVWLKNQADVYCYMDTDLSTDLGCLPKLVEPILNGECDVTVGSRLSKESVTTRSFKRELLSRGYNLLVRLLCSTEVSDAQCGFKAVNRKIINEILPLVENNEWFFDTELLTLAEKEGYKIKNIPIKWKERQESKVNLMKTTIGYISSIIELRFRLWGPR